mmetsp:Transcript_6506/g.21943  ORF Transcript_6506/g.21943 Transcript_6506/m.21943 type:complete len:216 (+) Transcript_6506:116-763(+)
MVAYMKHTNKSPPAALPSVEGTKFLANMSAHVTAWASTVCAAGRKNMFATMCSPPAPTKAAMGTYMPTARPVKSRAELAIQAPTHTSQLARMPLAKVAPKERPVLSLAMSTKKFPEEPSSTSPRSTSKYTTVSAPARFPIQITSHASSTWRRGTSWCQPATPSHMEDVQRSHPATATMMRPKGNRSANARRALPMLSSSAMPLARQTARRAPKDT